MKAFRLFLLGVGLVAVSQIGLMLPATARTVPVTVQPEKAERPKSEESEQQQPNAADLSHRITELFAIRNRWLLTGEPPVPPEELYDLSISTGRWALAHEKGRVQYVRKWAENRGIEFVLAKPEPEIYIKYLGSKQPDRARFYVTQSLRLGYRYKGETALNESGVGTRHILELRKKGDRWLIGLEWYSDPLGEEGETPDVSPALALPGRPMLSVGQPGALPAAGGGYNREGAVAYADKFCGMAWGCGNNHRYNPRYRDYNGVGGDCTNFASQALRVGGGLRVGNHLQASSLAGALQGSGRGSVTARAPFRELWKMAKRQPNGFRSMLKIGDLVFYQEKGKLAHSAIVTGFDSHGYPLVNSHNVDRYHVPFDLGWDRRTTFWFLRIWG